MSTPVTDACALLLELLDKEAAACARDVEKHSVLTEDAALDALQDLHDACTPERIKLICEAAMRAERLEAALALVEWDGNDYCPLCDNHKNRGHVATCPIRAALVRP